MGWAGERRLPKTTFWVMGVLILLGTAAGIFRTIEARDRARARLELDAVETQVADLATSFAQDLETVTRRVKMDLLAGRLTTRGVLWAARIEGGKISGWISSPKAPQHSGIDPVFGASLLERFEARQGEKAEQESYEGISMIRIRKDPFRPGEWLAIRSAERTELAIVDAAECFTPKMPTEGGLTRAYLVTSEGTVLSHSLKGYANSDFSRQPVFDQGARFASAGGVRHGRFSAIDGAVVDASFTRVGSLPILVVLERPAVIYLSMSNSIYGAIRSSWIGIKRSSEVLIPLLLALLGLWAAIWAAIKGWSFWNQRSRSEVMRTEATPAGASLGHEDSDLESLLEALSEDQPLKSPAGLMLEPMPRRQVAVSEQRRRPVSDTLPPSVIEPLADSARLEEELKRALHEPERQHFYRQNREIMVSMFEQDLEHAPDELAALDQLTQLVHQLTGSPVLLFQYQPHLFRASLESIAGGPPDLAAHGMSFPISSEMLLKAAECRAKDEILSMSDHVPLATLMLRRFQTARYCAWAIPSKGQTPMAGVLIVLEPNERLRDSAVTLSRAFRATGRVFPKNVHSSKNPSKPPSNPHAGRLEL